MPRPIQKRKEVSNLGRDERLQTPDLRVSMSQRINAARNTTSGIDSFVQNLGNFTRREIAAENERLGLQAATDVSAGTVDETLMGRFAYRDGVHNAQGAADAANSGLDLYEDAKRDRALARDEGREWDADEFTQARLEEVRNSEAYQQSEQYRNAFEGTMSKVVLKMKAENASEMATAELEAGDTAFRSLIMAQLRAGSFEPAVLAQYAEAMQIPTKDQDVLTQEVFRSHAVQAETLEELQPLRDYLEGLAPAKRAVAGDELTNSLRAAEARIETNNEKVTQQDYRTKAVFNFGLNKLIEAGDPSALEQIEAGRVAGLLTDSEAETKVGNVLTRNEQLRTEAAWDSNFVTFGENPERYALVTDSTERSHYQKRADETSALIVNSLTQIASNLSDPNNLPAVREALSDQLYKVKELMDITRNTGLEGDPLTTLLDAAENPTVDNIVELAEIYDSVTDVVGAGYLDSVSPEASINLHRASIMTRAGYTPERIREVLSMEADGRTYDAAYAAVIDARKKGNKLVNKEDPVLDARDDFEAMFAAEYYMRTGDLSGSLQYAKKRSKEVLTEVDGRVVPKSGLPMGFGEQWPSMKPTTEKSLIAKGVIEEGTEWSLMPMAETDETGRFALFNEDTGDFIRDDDGRIHMLSGQDALMYYSGVVKAGEAKKEGRVARKAYERADARVRGPDYIEANPEITEGISP